MELSMSSNMLVMKYASKFTKLLRLVSDFVVSERIKMKRFKEGLAFYI